MTNQAHGGWDFSPAGARPVGVYSAQPTDATPYLASATGAVAETATNGAPARPVTTTGDRIRTGIRGLGQLLITLGVVLLLFVVYEVWVSNIYAHQRQDKVHAQFQQNVAKGADPLKGQDRLNLPSGKQVVIPAGQGFANLYIPRFGKDYAWTIVEGTSDGDLERGPGHYSSTAIPGQIGNFSIAGHRVGKGEPFLNLDQLVPGDPVVVQTAGNWYVYRILGSASDYAAAQKISNSKQRSAAIAAALAVPNQQGVVGREIVSPSSVDVIAPVPDHAGVVPSQALLTMTTCHPKYTADQRMILHAALARAIPANGAAIPKELAGGTL
jgi:sortase A